MSRQPTRREHIAMCLESLAEPFTAADLAAEMNRRTSWGCSTWEVISVLHERAVSVGDGLWRRA